MRHCNGCHEDKLDDDFHRGSSKCKSCKTKASLRWNKLNVERHREHCRGNHRRKQRLKIYGLTEASYQKMVRDQGGVCAICKEAKKLVIDHDHATGFVRGLLCSTCNSALGHVYDSKDILREAIAYLERSGRMQEA